MKFHSRMLCALFLSCVSATVVYGAEFKPGDTFKDCDACPEMVVVPAGEFMMGSPESEKGREDAESPRHRVTIPQALAVAKFEITYKEWDPCLAAGGCARIHWARASDWRNSKAGKNALTAKGEEYLPEKEDLPEGCLPCSCSPSLIDEPGAHFGDRPAITSWKEAKQYVAWLSKLTGKDYRLLSEAEWEYAARAGNPGKWSFGDDEAELDEYAWFKANSEGRTQAVGKKKPNAFGLYDMHGNAWEWVEDCWNGSYADKPRELNVTGGAWTAGDCSLRGMRGGGRCSDPGRLRSANRMRLNDYFRFPHIGFRVGRTLTH